jgi:hypothetical protein
MTWKIFLFCFVLIVFLFDKNSFAQINIASIDTNLWQVDSALEKTITIVPRIAIQSDTTIYFYESINGKQRNVMTICCRKNSKWVTGRFKGYKHFINSNSFFILPCNLNSLDFINSMDSIIALNGVTHYLINKDLFESKLDYSNLIFGFDSFVEISHTNQDEYFPQSYCSSLIAVERKEPPYDYFNYISSCEILRDSIFKK